MTLPHTLAFQFAALTSLPGLIGTILVVLIVVLFARIVLKVAWRIAIVTLVVALALWFLGLLGPLAGIVGV